jgi:HK97 family phage major capsid protein
MKTIFNRLLRMAGDTMDYSAIMLPPAKGFDASRQVMTPANYFSRTMERKDAPPELTAAEIKSWEDLKTVFLGTHKSLKTFIEKANGEIATTGKVATETTNAMKTLSESLNGLGTRLDKIEAKANRFGAEADVRKSTGEQFTALDDFKNIVSGTISKLRMDIKGLDIKAITNATGQNQPLVPDMRLPGVQILPNRILTIRDLLPVGRTSSNLVQYAKENVYTNNAGPQAGNSPTAAGENLVKNESDITFTLANAPVVTLAHFILVSRQVLDDAPMLESYINGRLMYGLKLEEEDEILNGDGQVGTIDGLMHQATGFNRSAAGTKIDILRRSMTQLMLSEYPVEAFVLNPIDWEDIELTKDTQGRYVIANPQSLLGPTLWGRPVIVTNSQTQGQFLTSNFTLGAMLWDRQQASVELSREDSDNFRRNMVTILAEERLALAVYRATALIRGTFPA